MEDQGYGEKARTTEAIHFVEVGGAVLGVCQMPTRRRRDLPH